MLPTTCIPSDYVVQLIPHIQGQSIRLHSCFQRSLNLIIGRRLLLILQVPSLGHSPFGIVVEGNAWPDLRRRIAAGATLTILGRSLVLEGRPLLTVSKVPGYRSRLIPGASGTMPAQRFHRLLLESLPPGGPQAGLAVLLPAWAPGEPIGACPVSDPWVQRAKAVAPAFTQAPPSVLVEAAQGLMGLGPGLTPSGDDFLLGFVGALWLQGETRVVRFLRRNLTLHLWQATNLISAQYLRHGMLGRFSSQLKGLLEELGRSRWEDQAVITAIHQVTAIGSTSGWDSLMGVLAGLYWAAGFPRSV